MILVCPNCSSRFKVKPEAIGEAGRTVRCAKCGHKWHAGPEDLIDPEDLKSLSAATQGAKKASAKKAPAKNPPAKPAPEKKAAAKKAAARVAPPPDDMADQYPDDDMDGPDRDNEDDLGAPPPPPMMDGPEPPPIPSEADFNPRSMVPMRRKSPLGAWIGLFVIVLLTGAGVYSFQKQIVAAYPPANKIYQALGIDVDLLGHGLELPEPDAEAVIDGNTRRLIIRGTVTNTTDQTVVIPKLAGTLNDATGNILHHWVFDAEKPEAFPGESISYETVVESPPRGATGLGITFMSDAEAKMLMDGGQEMKPADGHSQAPQSSEGHATTDSHATTESHSTTGSHATTSHQ